MDHRTGFMGQKNSVDSGLGRSTGGHEGLIASLDTEWAVFSESSRAREAFEKWRIECPVFAAFRSAGGLVAAMRTTGPGQVDQVLASLLRRAVEQDAPDRDVAVRMVLQIMLPRVAHLARELTYLRDCEDRESAAVEAMCEAIVTYPIVRWPRLTPLCLARHAGTLLRDRMVRTRRDAGREVAVDFQEGSWSLDRPWNTSSVEREVVRFLAAAVRRQRLTPTEARRLHACARCGSVIKAAELRGISVATMRKSRKRALEKLRPFVDDEYAEDLPI